ncbi:MAG: pantoate--beta-alanine ligase [Ginsengibacter sp.]
MILFKKITDLHNWVDNQQVGIKKVGFIPTMGALHAGHISLIKASKKENKITISSIFINPVQFNDSKDFDKYPVTLEKDILLLEEAECDILFLPSVKEIYPHGIIIKKQYDLGYIETVLEGKFRPGHFQGVCMVVHRLLEIVLPDRLYLGQKDYQQCIVIIKLIELIGMKEKIEVIISPTLREANGLAMSSRNMRLSYEEKEKATVIFKSLSMITKNFGKENPIVLKQQAQLMLVKAGLQPDYIEIVDATDLSIVQEWKENKKMVALAAAFINNVRLIDNIVINAQ